jgi:hypothetical protein
MKYIDTCYESFLPSLHTSLSCKMAPLTAAWVAETYKKVVDLAEDLPA